MTLSSMALSTRDAMTVPTVPLPFSLTRSNRRLFALSPWYASPRRCILSNAPTASPVSNIAVCSSMDDSADALSVFFLVMATTWFAIMFLRPYPRPSRSTGGPRSVERLAPVKSTVCGYLPMTAVLTAFASNMSTSNSSIIACTTAAPVTRAETV